MDFQDKTYSAGFRVGLSTHDDPVVPLGTVTQTIKAIERYVKESGPSWETGFWDGLAQQSYFENRVRAI